ncbi:hypothetical protein IPM19_02770 [bacterium]|nr:MAG: hypothetical protein IPM19_02770 [bacterium]
MSIKQKLAIVIIVVIAVLSGLVFVLVRSQSNNEPTKETTPTNLEALLEQRAVKSQGDILTLHETENFFITYDKVTKEFLIVLLPSQQTNAVINELRIDAEQQLLNFTGMDADSICSQKISLIIPPSYWPEMSGISYGFSFCEDFIPFNE